jgi:hypothetical protein
MLFILLLLVFDVWARRVSAPILLERVEPKLRGELYGSITGTSAGLLGFTIAAVSILLTMSSSSRTARFGRATQLLVHVLLSTSLCC